MAELIACRYARALFELSLENNELDECAEQAADIIAMFNDNGELYKICRHPGIAAEKRFEFVVKLLEGKEVSVNILGLCNVIFRKNREAVIIQVFEEFIRLFREHKGLATAFVTAAAELSESQLEGLREKLCRVTGKKIDVSVKIDKELIAGMRIEIEGKVVDGTVRHSLEEIKRGLLNIQLAR